MEKTWVWILTSWSNDVSWMKHPIIMGIFSSPEKFREKFVGEWNSNPDSAKSHPDQWMVRGEVQSATKPAPGWVAPVAQIHYNAAAYILDY